MKDRVVKGIFWLGGASLFSQAVTWISTIVVARLLDPADYGLIALAGIYIGFAEQINELGVGAAIIQRKDLNDQDVRGIYTVAIFVGLAMTVGTYLLAPSLAFFFKDNRLSGIIRFLSLTFLINSAKSIQRNLMVRDMRFAELAKMDGGSRIFTSLGALAFAVAGFGVWTLAGQYLLQNFIVLIWAFLYEKRLPGRIKDSQKIKEMLSFGVGISGSNLLFSINRNIDSFIVGTVIGKVSLGYYSFAQILADKPFEKILSIFNQVFYPVFAKVQDDMVKTREYLSRIMEMEIFLLTPIFILIIITAPELVSVLLGKKWELIVRPLQLFSTIAVFKYIENRINVVLRSFGNSRPQFIYMSVLVPVMAIAEYFSAVYYGINGVLGIWGAIYPMILFFYLKHFLFRTGMSFYTFFVIWKSHIVSAVIMICSAVVISVYFHGSEIEILLAKIFVSAGLYTIVSYFINRKVMIELIDLVSNKLKPVVPVAT